MKLEGVEPPTFGSGIRRAANCAIASYQTLDNYMLDTHTERFGAAVARWAHNPKVRGSKPRIAMRREREAPGSSKFIIYILVPRHTYVRAR